MDLRRAGQQDKEKWEFILKFFFTSLFLFCPLFSCPNFCRTAHYTPILRSFPLCPSVLLSIFPFSFALLFLFYCMPAHLSPWELRLEGVLFLWSLRLVGTLSLFSHFYVVLIVSLITELSVHMLVLNCLFLFGVYNSSGNPFSKVYQKVILLFLELFGNWNKDIRNSKMQDISPQSILRAWCICQDM